MKHKYNIPDLLTTLVGYRAEPFPASAAEDQTGSYGARPFPEVSAGEQKGGYKGGPYEVSTSPVPRQELVKGTRLYKQDMRGRWYFMPVYIHHKDISGIMDTGVERSNSNNLELQNAVVSIKGKKNIVETAMVGRKGTVKELINIDDYAISITAFIQSTDGSYPEEEITRIRNLFNINESVELISVLTDLVLDEGDKVVITSIDYPSTPGIEDGQAIRIECVTDKEFELIIQ